MFEVIWLTEARDDLVKHFDFLNEKNPEAASKASRAILSATASLTKFPNRGSIVPDTDKRKLRILFGKYGYIVIYRVSELKVFILKVHHGRSDRKN